MVISWEQLITDGNHSTNHADHQKLFENAHFSVQGSMMLTKSYIKVNTADWNRLV